MSSREDWNTSNVHLSRDGVNCYTDESKKGDLDGAKVFSWREGKVIAIPLSRKATIMPAELTGKRPQLSLLSKRE